MRWLRQGVLTVAAITCGRASSVNLEGGSVNGGVGSTNREGGTLVGR